jgi:hypothetical protein
MSNLVDDTAEKAHDYFGTSAGGGSSNPPSWWEKVKRWVTEYLKPLVPAVDLALKVAQVMDILRKWFGGR